MIVFQTVDEKVVTWRTLLGDVNANGSVTGADVNITKANFGAATGANFRADFNADGTVLSTSY